MGLDQGLLSTYKTFSECLGRVGVTCQSFIPEESPIDEVPPATAAALLSFMETYSELIAGLPQEQLSSRDCARKLTEAFMRKFNLKFADPFFLECLEEGDILEIYTAQHVQLFSSPRFFELSSYDIITMSCTPWNLLFRRPEGVVEKMIEVCQDIVKNVTPRISPEIERHLVQEIYQRANKVLDYEVRFAGAVVTGDLVQKVQGYVSIIRAREVS